jgi:hypothetical protein
LLFYLGKNPNSHLLKDTVECVVFDDGSVMAYQYGKRNQRTSSNPTPENIVSRLSFFAGTTVNETKATYAIS